MDAQVTKSTGEKEAFHVDKLCQSIVDAGAPDALAKGVCEVVAKRISPETTTNQIFREALNYLVDKDLTLSANYSLKRGVASLGPTGFLFEQYMEAVFQAYGWETHRNVTMQGSCISHEIDITLANEDLHALVEAKYHNQRGLKTHVDVVMYADARFQDITRYQDKHEAELHGDIPHQMWLVTNTKFTSKAIQYAECRNLKLIGWKYPKEGSLEDLIVEKHLYPVTVLPSVSSFEKEQLFEKGLVLAQDLLPYTRDDLVREFALPPEISRKILDEVYELVS